MSVAYSHLLLFLIATAPTQIYTLSLHDALPISRDSSDIAAAVDFARRHRLRLVVKGTGHDYLGRSNAPDSLLLWTHNMRQVSPHDAFVGRGCAAAQTGVPAVSVRAGARWLEVYQAVTVRGGRYVQGGGCGWRIHAGWRVRQLVEEIRDRGSELARGGSGHRGR